MKVKNAYANSQELNQEEKRLKSIGAQFCIQFDLQSLNFITQSIPQFLEYYVNSQKRDKYANQLPLISVTNSPIRNICRVFYCWMIDYEQFIVNRITIRLFSYQSHLIVANYYTKLWNNQLSLNAEQHFKIKQKKIFILFFHLLNLILPHLFHFIKLPFIIAPSLLPCIIRKIQFPKNQIFVKGCKMEIMVILNVNETNKVVIICKIIGSSQEREIQIWMKSSIVRNKKRRNFILIQIFDKMNGLLQMQFSGKITFSQFVRCFLKQFLVILTYLCQISRFKFNFNEQSELNQTQIKRTPILMRGNNLQKTSQIKAFKKNNIHLFMAVNICILGLQSCNSMKISSDQQLSNFNQNFKSAQ